MNERELLESTFKNLSICDNLDLKKLTELFYGKNELKCQDIANIVGATLELPSTLKILKIIAEGLKINQSILKLELGYWVSSAKISTGISINQEGAQIIADILKYNNTLQVINLASHNIGDVGAEHLAAVLINHPSVQEINLSNNKIKPLGFKHIALMLKKNQVLKKINLMSNCPSDESCQYLAEALNSNTKIAAILLGQCYMTSKGLKMIIDTFKNKPINYIFKQASMFRHLMTVTTFGGCDEKIEQLSITDKIKFLNIKIESYKKCGFLVDPVDPVVFPGFPSLRNLTTHWIKHNRDKIDQKLISDLPTELQEELTTELQI